MLMLLLSLIVPSYAQDVGLRGPDVSPSFFQEQLTLTKLRSFADVTAEQFLKRSPNTAAMDRCLEALANNDQDKEAQCFESMQALKNELWTAPLRRVLIPFLDRLIDETKTHRKLYSALKQSLEQNFTFGRMSGLSDLALRDQKLFLKWLSEQPEWQDARIFVNGFELSETPVHSDKAVAQWFVLSNAGRSLSYIGTQRGFQKFLKDSEDFRFLDCKSVAKNSFPIDSFTSAIYIYSSDCIVPLKKQTIQTTPSIYQRWQESQTEDVSAQRQLEKPSTLPKWVVPLAVGLAIGAVALKGKKISVRAPEF